MQTRQHYLKIAHFSWRLKSTSILTRSFSAQILIKSYASGTIFARRRIWHFAEPSPLTIGLVGGKDSYVDFELNPTANWQAPRARATVSQVVFSAAFGADSNRQVPEKAYLIGAFSADAWRDVKPRKRPRLAQEKYKTGDCVRN
jgi:hypothetical protein